MHAKKYSPFNSFVQNVASSRAGAWLFAPILHHMDAAFLKLSRGRMTLSSVLAGIPTVILTATGAKTGRSRPLPLLCIRDEHDPSVFALIATNWGRHRYPAWYFNLKAYPHVKCSIDGQTGLYVAREAAGEEYDRFWRYATETYKGYLLYRQRITGRHIPIMVMRPALVH